MFNSFFIYITPAHRKLQGRVLAYKHTGNEKKGAERNRSASWEVPGPIVAYLRDGSGTPDEALSISLTKAILVIRRSAARSTAPALIYNSS